MQSTVQYYRIIQAYNHVVTIREAEREKKTQTGTAMHVSTVQPKITAEVSPVKLPLISKCQSRRQSTSVNKKNDTNE